MAELALKEPQGIKAPARTVPPELFNTQVVYFLHWLELLLGVKDTKENEKRIKFLHSQIQETAWGLSIIQLKEAFQMYVDGKLSYNNSFLEPVSGFVDTIQFKKVIQAYKQEKAPKMDLKEITKSVYGHWIEHQNLEGANGVELAFDYLYDNGWLPKKGEERIDKAYNRKMEIAKGYVYAPLFDKRKWMQKEDLQDVGGFKKLNEEIQEVIQGDHPKVKEKFKQIVLEGYFKKLKKPLNELL